MSEENPTDRLNKLLFTNLVMMLSASAMQQLGKVVDPATNKAQVNLEGAQLTIDMLAMIKEKTKGNLDPDEDRVLSDSLSSLQLNYVETAKQATEEPEKAPESGSEPPAGDAEATGETGTPPPDDKQAPGPEPTSPRSDPKDPKFHRSYGS